MAEIPLTAEHVSYAYGHGQAEVRAVDDVSLEVRSGQVTLIMGPSGSGKTTMLSILGCLLTPQAGRVSLLGQAVLNLDDEAKAALRRRHVGFVFQNFRLFRSLSARDNVITMLEIDGVKGRPARERAEAVLASLGLEGKLGRRPGEMSGGEKQRVAIARALVHDPQLLLADEPTASLDSSSGRAVAQILRGLAIDAGRAVVVVTHDPRLEPFADRVVRMRDGRVVPTEGDAP